MNITIKEDNYYPIIDNKLMLLESNIITWTQFEDELRKLILKSPEKPDAYYYLGKHYYEVYNQVDAGYDYLKRAYLRLPNGYKHDVSKHLKLLCNICYLKKEYDLGFEISEVFLKNIDNKDEVVIGWYSIFSDFLKFKQSKTITKNLPILIFIADGGYVKWSGSSILKDGVGGSETYIIEVSKYVAKTRLFDVYVFCNCENDEVFEGVTYMNLQSLYSFLKSNVVNTCIVSRFSNYLPLVYESNSQNVYFILHDITSTCPIMINDDKLKNVFCLSEWHTSRFSKAMPSFSPKTTHHYYGIDPKFIVDKKERIPYKFIYSSYPNRGLLQLLQMWPQIHQCQPLASLHIYCDINSQWANLNYNEMMNSIKELFNKYEVHKNNMNIYYHGWVNKQTLADSWKTADIWFYPNIFNETFCLTALEAAASKTLAICNDNGALQNTVGDRGIIIPGDPHTDEWKENAFGELKKYLTDDVENNKKKQECIDKNYEWAKNLTWEKQTHKLMKEYLLKGVESYNFFE